MRKVYVLCGVSSIAVGIIIMFLQVPYTSTYQEQVERSGDILNESFVVPPRSHLYRNATIHAGENVTSLMCWFRFTINGTIDFWVMYEEDYLSHFLLHSQQRNPDIIPHIWYLNASNDFDRGLGPPLNQSIYFIWDNYSYSSAKSVTAHFYKIWAEAENRTTIKYRMLIEPTESATLFILLFIGGMISAYYGFAPASTLERKVAPPSESELHPRQPSPFGYCRYCGAVRTSNSVVCEKCGKKIG